MGISKQQKVYFDSETCPLKIFYHEYMLGNQNFANVSTTVVFDGAIHKESCRQLKGKCPIDKVSCSQYTFAHNLTGKFPLNHKAHATLST